MKKLAIALVALSSGLASAQGKPVAEEKSDACAQRPASQPPAPAKAIAPKVAAQAVAPRPATAVAPKPALAQAPATPPPPAPDPAPEPPVTSEPPVAPVLLAAPVSAPPAAPAPVPQGRRPTVGFGIGIVPFDSRYSGLPYEIYLPINVSSEFRLEPSAGALTNIPRTGGVERSFVTLGLGAFWVDRVAPSTDVYLGGRVKMCIVTTDDGVTNDSENDFTLAAAIGGEFYVGSNFSVGAEAQFGHYQNGRLFGYLAPNDRGTFTTGVAFLRFYVR